MFSGKFPAIIKPSTKALWRTGRELKDYSIYDFLHGYIYARFPYLYIGIGTGEHWVVKRFGPVINVIISILSRLVISPTDNIKNDATERRTTADTYHGKVVPLTEARELVTLNTPVDLYGLEQIIPYKHATDIVMRNPDHIVALKCPCRASRSEPCTPLDVCLIVGEPFASFVMDHHGSRARWISQSEAVDILRAEDERGHVHHAFFKDAMLGRFYAICNCCSCCCGAVQVHRNGTPMLASSGYICVVDDQMCIGCENCLNYCQFGALSVENGYSTVTYESCFGCGVCIDKCEQGALSLVADQNKGIPLKIRELMGEVLAIG